jgi:hypothetical protein
MMNILGLLCLWSLIGYFLCGAVPNPTDKKAALKQTFWLGPIFWIGISIWGICVFIKRKCLTK